MHVRAENGNEFQVQSTPEYHCSNVAIHQPEAQISFRLYYPEKISGVGLVFFILLKNRARINRGRDVKSLKRNMRCDQG